jgi:gluconate 5-dehydrogenase
LIRRVGKGAKAVQPIFDLSGQVAVVTGAGRGLGRAMAQGLAAAGARVFVTGRNAAALAEVTAAIAAAGGEAQALVFDVVDPAAATRALQEAGAAHGRLDIVINNVARRDRRPLNAFSLDDVRRLIDVDLVAPFHICREASKLMIPAKYGRIINMTSIAGPLAGTGDAPYTAAKGGLEALTRALAAELGEHGITVNAIAPGFFATEANAAAVADQSIAAWLKRRTSLGRWGEPDEIAGAAVFLASPAAGYVTGHVLVVDGGMMTRF